MQTSDGSPGKKSLSARVQRNAAADPSIIGTFAAVHVASSHVRMGGHQETELKWAKS
jgi:hypothetical protein